MLFLPATGDITIKAQLSLLLYLNNQMIPCVEEIVSITVVCNMF